MEYPNPEPLPSNLPPEVECLSVKLDKVHLAEEVRNALQKWQRMANYIAAGTFYDKYFLMPTSPSHDFLAGQRSPETQALV